MAMCGTAGQQYSFSKITIYYDNFIHIALLKQGLQIALTNKAEQIKGTQLKLQLKNVEQTNGIEIVNS